MTLWLFLSLLTALAALAIALPFLRGPAPDAAGKAGIEVFREQARQLERDHAAGIVTAEDAAATRREIERRVVAAARKADGEQMAGLGSKGQVAAVAVTVGWVVVGSALLYGATGRPELAGVVAKPARGVAASPLAILPPPSGAMTAPGAAAPVQTPEGSRLDDVDTMIARLAARLEGAPGDVEGWKMLGWSYSGTGRYEDAAGAYARAAALAPGDADILALQAEALVRADADRVTDRAAAVIARALDLDPGNPRARFFNGLAMDQAGDAMGAVTLWLDILDKAPLDTAWTGDLRDRIRERAGAAGIDLAGRRGFAPEADTAPAATPGPTAADVAAASQMSTEDRQAMIRGMVDRLAERLEGAPDDLEGWHKLIRARMVLGERAEAAAALARARGVFAGDAGALARLDAAAVELGLN